MAPHKVTQKNRSESPETASDHIEDRVVAFAEQLGFLIGTVQAKAEGWLDREALSKAVGQIRDSAADLLDHVSSKSPLRKKAAAQPKATSATSRSRGPVDAPGKRHRKPPPQEPIAKRMGEPQGRQMGQKSVKNGRRGTRA